MKLVSKLLSGAALAMALSNPASAATYNVSNGILMGAYDVNVGGELYDVAFKDDVFSNSYITFTTLESATAASQALINQVFNNNDEFDATSTKTNGCTNGSSLCTIFTGYQTSGNFVDATTANNYSGTSTDTVAVGAWNKSFSTAISGQYTLAIWTKKATKPAATAVPEPEAYAMMLAGLGLVGFAARRKLAA